ncbi:MAG: M48 family metallopeptidase [Dehalococcoidia bacterium]
MPKRSPLIVAGLLLVLHGIVGAPAHAAAAVSPPIVSQVESDSVAQAAGEPVAVPEPSEKAMRYYRSGNVLWFVNVIWGILIPALFLFTGFSARIRDWAVKLGRKWLFVIATYFVIFLVANYLVDFTLEYYQGYVRQHAYDLSNQTFSKWFTDSLKSLMVGVIAGVLFLWIPYLLLKRSPRRWWFYTSLAMIPFLFFVLLVSPIWVDPLFNDFGPMRDKSLEVRILGLADRAGIDGGRVYEVNKSVDTEAVNAYVTGFVNTKRIVLWDTIINKLDDEELLFVMGHEMGHYVLGHVWKSILFISLMLFVALYMIHRTAGSIIQRCNGRFGFDRLSDIASLPLLILLFNIFSLVLIPVAFTFSRYLEHEADRFGVEITQNNRAAAVAFVKLQTENLGNPRPGFLYKIWRSTHPTLGQRIDFCNTYRPWQTGEALRYGRLFTDD